MPPHLPEESEGTTGAVWSSVQAYCIDPAPILYPGHNPDELVSMATWTKAINANTLSLGDFSVTSKYRVLPLLYEVAPYERIVRNCRRGVVFSPGIMHRRCGHPLSWRQPG